MNLKLRKFVFKLGAENGCKEQERSLPVKSFPEYLVTENGMVLNATTGYIIQPYEKRGYLRIRINKNNRRYDFGVHNLVAKSFISEKSSDFEVNHKDKNRHNNHYSNLEWLTHADNVRYSRNKPIKVKLSDGSVIEFNSRVELSKYVWNDDRASNIGKYLKIGGIPKYNIQFLN